MKVLFVEDDLGVVRDIVNALALSYVVERSWDERTALTKARQNDYGLIILGPNLIGTRRLLFCRELRASAVASPLIILADSPAGDDELINVLDAGADDFLALPLNIVEVSARVRALLRRSYPDVRDDTVVVGDLAISLSQRQVRRSGRLICLRRKEFDLLEYLACNSGRVMTRQMILDHVWDSDANIFNNTVDVHIKYLRDKIDRSYPKKLIRTVHGLGYKITT